MRVADSQWCRRAPWLALAFQPALAFLLLLAISTSATATNYKFPGGNMPPGCSGNQGVYTCGSITLGYNDTITINGQKPAVININGNLSTDTSTINVDGSSSDLTLNISGTLNIGYAASIKANVSAASIVDGSGQATIDGSLSTSGSVSLKYLTSVTGSITTQTGAVTLEQGNVIGGSVTSTSGAINLGTQGRVAGSIGTSGAITLGQDSRVTGNISGSSGKVDVGYAAQVTGTITTSSGAVSLAQNSVVSACIKSTGSASIALGYQASANSVCCGTTCSNSCVANNSGYVMPALCSGSPSSAPHHLEIRHATGTGLTCAPSTLTIAACQDAACTTPYTGGVTGTLTASGTSMTVNWPSGTAFSIPAGSSSVTQSVQVATAGNVTLGTTSTTPAPTNSTTCNFGSPSCRFTAADSGFLFDVPHHVSEVSQTVAISAVRKSDNSLACVPAFASVSKSVTFSCAYQNPTTGTLPVRVGGRALNSGNNSTAACDAGGQAVSLAFNASGVASTTVQYADAGQMLLSARYGGSSGSETGLVMTGSDSFIAAPASFVFSAITAGPIRAGSAFAGTVTANNSAGNATPNFGRESSPTDVTLSFTRRQPTGSGASDGTFTGSLGGFSSGAATAGNLVWSEVGRGDLTAALTGSSYLSSGLNVTGTTGTGGAVGRFIPHHFDVAVTPACSSFSYAGQPFTVSLTAKNGLPSPTTTLNYDGSTATSPTFAQGITLSDVPALGVGSFGSTASMAASQFIAGTASSNTPSYAFTNKITAPQTLVVRAIDADGVSSSGYAEGSTALRSGRLRMPNAFGSQATGLQITVQAQYWSGNAWVLNAADSCTSVPAAAVARSGYLDGHGAATSAWTTTASAIAFSGGNGTLNLSAPSPASTGSVDIALNLGATTTDQSCLATHPATAGGARPWLRAQNGNCAATWDRDPAARASFGIASPETRKTIHVRELF